MEPHRARRAPAHLIPVLALLLHALFAGGCTDSESSALGVGPDGLPLGKGSGFSIRMDAQAWERWGFRYPVTTVFSASRVSRVYRRDGEGEWRLLAPRNPDDLYNGVEGARFDRDTDQAFVSVGFEGDAQVQIWFDGDDTVIYLGPSDLYDGRTAAYTLSNDNWGRSARGNDGAEFLGMTHDDSDKYQAAVHAARSFGIPISIAINSNRDPATEAAKWENMQTELDYGDFSWEPAVHTLTHPCSAQAYGVQGYQSEIIGSRDEILQQLTGIPYGPYVFEFVLPCGFDTPAVEQAAAGEFLFLRAWDEVDHLEASDTWFAPWNMEVSYYGVGGYQTKSYDPIFQARDPAGRFFAEDVQALNQAFDQVLERGGIFYAMFHSDRYQNSVIYDQRPGVDGQQGSSLMQHLEYVSGRPDVWYVANGWLYLYRYAAQNLVVEPLF